MYVKTLDSFKKTNVIKKISNKRLQKKFTLKKFSVEPPLTGPYLISVCLLRASTFSKGVIILSTVIKAARLAV